jgi:hypothetical protein
MDPSTSGIVAVTLKPLAYYLFGCLLKKLNKSKESTLIGVIIPSSCGKTELVKQLNEMNNELLFIDIETECLHDIPESEKKIIIELKKNNILLYNQKVFSICKTYIINLIQHIKNVKDKKTIILIMSSVELQKYLKLENVLYYAPSKKLYQTIKTFTNININMLDYTRNQLNNIPSLKIYNDWFELSRLVITDLKLKMTL